MIKFYFRSSCKIFSLIACLTLGLFTMSSVSGTTLPMDTVRIKLVKTPGKLTDTRVNKPSFLKTGLRVIFSPFRPGDMKPASQQSTKQTAQPIDSKLLTNVKVYPNPVDDQINFSYHINKNSTVTIKIMDLLGNEISTLMSQKMNAGEQLNSFNISAKLNSGIYFIHIMAGNELSIKRISVL